jgi:hypothetical protein
MSLADDLFGGLADGAPPQTLLGQAARALVSGSAPGSGSSSNSSGRDATQIAKLARTAARMPQHRPQGPVRRRIFW